MKKFKLGIIGIGKMGSSILQGLIKSGLYQKSDILLYDADLDKVNMLSERGYEIAEKELALFQSVEMLILAIKPQLFASVLSKLQDSQEKTTIISIAAGITIEYMKKYLGEQKYIRVMPNTPAAIGYGTTIITRNDKVDDETFIKARRIFENLGIVEEVKEEDIDAIIPINGSMPAYLYYFVKAFVETAKIHGINEKIAKYLAANSVIGSAQMLLQSNKTIDELINDVCSPGGTTIAGMNILKDNHFEEIIEKASLACTNRSKELKN